MLKQLVAAALGWAWAFGALSAQEPGKVDFRRDVQPLFKAYCIDCHGPKQQKNGFRLDRRRDAMKGGTLTMIGPGNSAASRLYLKLLSDRYGPQMPLDGPLKPEQINIIKAWIDQGAVWPDDVSGETPPPPPDPKAARIMEALRKGDREEFHEILRDDPKVANLKGPGGSTPLMFAVLYGDADTVRVLLDTGAGPNIRNEAGATALMWATDDPEKTRLLLAKGADAKARSEDGRTPLLIAAGRFGSSAVVKLLLEAGADPSVKAHGLLGPTTPLSQAAQSGDEAVLRLLLESGADVKGAGTLPLILALNAGSPGCVDRLLKSADVDTRKMALGFIAPPFAPLAFGDRGTVQRLLDHGADVKAADPAGRTMLMLAASTDTLPVDIVKTFLERGADVHAKSADGKTALDFARQQGQTPIVDLLRKAGAREDSASPGRVLKPKPAGSVRAALERSIPLLQRTDVSFRQKAGCVSCHHNTLTARTIASARKHGLRVDDPIAQQQVKAVASYIDGWRERALQGVGIPGDADTVSSILLGMAAENYPPDLATDALARFLKNYQSPDGHWQPLAHRPPLEASTFQTTADSLRAIQQYRPQTQRAEYEKAVRLAAEWLRKAQPRTTTDRGFQLLGLGWAGGNEEIIRKAARELLTEQRPDGGWAQLPTLGSDAFATGQALVALKEAGVLVTTDAPYQRGVQFLLATQLEDGSWYVKSRSLPFQPYFESDFPHGPDQWISAAATNWAAMALAPAAR
jgi:ankyrin repeat protein